MADIICRWRNSTPETVMELVNSMPHTEISSLSFHEFMKASIYGESFFTTPYQLACQLGLYFDDGTKFHPRFAENIDIDQAQRYLEIWVHKYYAPNPYTKSLKHLQTPVYLVGSLVSYLENHGKTNLTRALEDIFGDSMGNLDIIRNLLNNYSNVINVEKDGIASLKENYKEYISTIMDRNDKFSFFHSFDEMNKEKPAIADSLQQIFYGAPGTGKSHSIKVITEQYEKEGHVIRTTFHPDSDYSTFVGAYKPTAKEIVMRDMTGHIVKEDGKVQMENRIIYEFVPQAFIQAYVAAWKHLETPEFLIIEEINRGNCAQIFGDLFQLLDRNEDGFSDYPIKADNDLQAHLQKAFKDVLIENYPNVQNGSQLLLPPNLYIWATMNTSDQSLFPIDSAFKRRWDWQYVPIEDAKLNWRVAVAGKEYNWWSFLSKVNEYIGSITSSEDKKLGYFFCKAQNGIISAKTFVGKVCFYLWNDVFKDYGFDSDIFATSEGQTITFDRFYKSASVIDENVVGRFLDNLGVEVVAKVDVDDDEEEFPNHEETELGDKSKDSLSVTEKKRYEFWESFLNYAHQNVQFDNFFPNVKKASTDHWKNFYIAGLKDFHLAAMQVRSKKCLEVQVYFNETTDLYHKFFAHKTEIEQEMGVQYEWNELPDKKASIISEKKFDVDFENPDAWRSYFDFFIDRLLRMREVFSKYANL